MQVWRICATCFRLNAKVPMLPHLFVLNVLVPTPDYDLNACSSGSRYMAPEFADTPVPSCATDIFAFGVTCFEVLKCGAKPSNVPTRSSQWSVDAPVLSSVPRWTVPVRCLLPTLIDFSTCVKCAHVFAMHVLMMRVRTCLFCRGEVFDIGTAHKSLDKEEELDQLLSGMVSLDPKQR